MTFAQHFGRKMERGIYKSEGIYWKKYDIYSNSLDREMGESFHPQRFVLSGALVLLLFISIDSLHTSSM